MKAGMEVGQKAWLEAEMGWGKQRILEASRTSSGRSIENVLFKLGHPMPLFVFSNKHYKKM